MANGTPTPNPTPSGNGNNKLDIGVLNNGVKLLGEAVVPGASLMLEDHVGAGLLLTAVGLLGGAALGSVFGPFGYLLARYGASAASFSQSLEQPPPTPPANGPLTQQVSAMRQEVASLANKIPPAFAASPQSDLAEQIATALRRVPELRATVAPPGGTTQIDVVAMFDKMHNRLDEFEATLKTMQPAGAHRKTS